MNLFITLLGSSPKEEHQDRFLSWLIDPTGDHDLGPQILHELQARAGISTVIPDDLQVHRQFRLPDGSQVDLAIESSAQLLLIEDKVAMRSVSGEQIQRYVDQGRRLAGNREFALLLLLPTQEQPEAMWPGAPKEFLVLYWGELAAILAGAVANLMSDSFHRRLIEQYSEYVDISILSPSQAKAGDPLGSRSFVALPLGVQPNPPWRRKLGFEKVGVLSGSGHVFWLSYHGNRFAWSEVDEASEGRSYLAWKAGTVKLHPNGLRSVPKSTGAPDSLEHPIMAVRRDPATGLGLPSFGHLDVRYDEEDLTVEFLLCTKRSGLGRHGGIPGPVWVWPSPVVRPQ